ncbi:MAG: ATP-binding protein [Candidatus Sumerlaeia bacterium]|nr:ATP-binding protein [Candidatus Sumerlaeia bacterium]
MSGSAPVQLIPKAPQPGFPDFYAIGDGSTTIGRHPTNTIVLPFESISRFHARLDKRGDYFIVQDLNSSNGSFVNNERVTQMTIHHGDVVTFGNVEFLFQNEESQGGLHTSASSIRGKNIVDILDDSSDPSSANLSQSVLRADEVRKEKSSVITTFEDRKADRATLVRLNARLRGLYKLSELLRESAAEAEEDVLLRVLDVVFECIVADRGVVLTRFVPEATQFDVAAVKYRDLPIMPQKVTVSRTILDRVVSQKVAVLSRDAMSDERFEASESIIMSNVRSTICVPMMMGDKVMGILHLDTSSTQRSFTEDDLEFATIIATETGVALENSRMRKAAIHRERLAAVGETVAGISHNVKNILLLSQGGAELLSRGLERGSIEDSREAWGVVKRGIDKIGALVRDMLEYSSNKALELKEVDVNDLICAIAEEVEPDLLKNNVMLELDLDDAIGVRQLDETGMHRTILNLIVNSMEAISHGEGRILITTARIDGGGYRIMIRDNGSGIPADKLERIFFPFFTTKGSKGTGLGLSMCKKCVEDQAGKLTVESEENVGTVFFIEMPETVPGAVED